MKQKIHFTPVNAPNKRNAFIYHFDEPFFIRKKGFVNYSAQKLCNYDSININNDERLKEI